jgi:hypothetical protein
VRPPFPTTSPAAIATARILAAYLANHKLSPAEAASLGGRIADALVSLTNATDVKSETPLAQAEKPAPKRRAKAGISREARTVAVEATMPEPIAEPEPEPDAQPMAEREPEDRPVPAAEPIQAAPPEASVAAEFPRKRKRPSRPRSKRGQGAAPAPEAMSAEAPHSDEPHDAAAVETAVFSEPVTVGVAAEAGAVAGAEAGAEAPASAPKPRRATSRARRATAP